MKKLFSLLLCTFMVLNAFILVNAENELAGAKTYTLGASRSGNILEGHEKDVYKFDLATSGEIDISFSSDMERVDLKLYDATGEELWNDHPYWNSTTEEISFQKDLVLCKGTYYFSVSKSWGKWEGEYKFTIKETAIYETFAEEQKGNNNATKTANTITHGSEYVGCIAVNDDVDVYQFNLAAAGKLDVHLSSDMERLDLKLYDATGKELWNDRPYWNSTTEEISYEANLYLCKGLYYISASKSWGKCEGSYSLMLLFTSANESFAEEQNGTNNKTKVANRIVKNQIYNGFIAMNDDVDIYIINIEDTTLDLNLSANLERVEIKLYDASGKEMWNERPYWNGTIEEMNFVKEVSVTPGMYYLSISKSWGVNEGFYSFYFSDGTVAPNPPVMTSSITVTVNGKNVAFDQPPILLYDRTLVPLRAIFEALGAEVLWDGNTQTVTATKGSVEISLQIGSNQMYVNNNLVVLDVPAQLINSRTLVPVRAVSEAFGCKVDWIQSSQTVVIAQ